MFGKCSRHRLQRLDAAQASFHSIGPSTSQSAHTKPGVSPASRYALANRSTRPRISPRRPSRANGQPISALPEKDVSQNGSPLSST